MEAALGGEKPHDRRKAQSGIGHTGKPFDASGGLRLSTRRAAPLLASRFVAGLAGIPDTGLRPAPAGPAKIGSSAAPSEVHNSL